MGYLVLGIILVVVFVVVTRFISRWLHRRGKIGLILHNLFFLIGTIVMLIFSIVMRECEGVASILGGGVIYIIIAFLTFFWLFSSAEDDYETEEWETHSDSYDPTTETSSHTTKKTVTTTNNNSLLNVLKWTLMLAAICAVATCLLVAIDVPWVPSAIAVFIAAYFMIKSFRS